MPEPVIYVLGGTDATRYHHFDAAAAGGTKCRERDRGDGETVVGTEKLARQAHGFAACHCVHAAIERKRLAADRKARAHRNA